MKIAIVSKMGSGGHMECLGFLLELLRNFSVTIFFQNGSDRYNWMDYYKTIYNFNSFNHLNININEFNKIIKLSNNDDCLMNEDTISLLHLKCLINSNNKSRKFISLTPYISGDNIYYIFPIFKPVIRRFTSNIVLFVGYYLNSNFDEDTTLFIERNPEYHFIFIIWAEKEYNKLKKYKNVTVLHDVKTNNLIDYVNNSKYIMSKKYINYDRFSGQLGLAMSFEKPMFIDSKTATSYNLPGFVFNSNYNELGKISNISDDSYNNMIHNIKKFNETTLNNNKLNINNILS